MRSSLRFRPGPRCAVTAGVALAATGVVVAAPVVPSAPSALAPRVTLTAGSSVLSPYVDLVTNSAGNLRILADDWLEDPAPFFRQVLSNLLDYGQTTVTSLANATRDFGAGLAALPASLQVAFQDLVAGNVGGALNEVVTALANLFVTGLDAGNPSDITLAGSIGDLLPILGIPADIAQNATNTIRTITDTVISLAVTGVYPKLVVDLLLGLPMSVTLDALGSLVTSGTALAESVSAFADAAQAGDPAGALTVLVDAPADVANGFLNGEDVISFTEQLSSPLKSVTVHLPVSGILASLRAPTAEVYTVIGPVATQVTGTPVGGLVPALVDYLPQQLAVAIGGPVAQGSAATQSVVGGVLDSIALPNLGGAPGLTTLSALVGSAAWTDFTSALGTLTDLSGLVPSLIP